MLESVILTERDISRTLTRLAHEIVEKNHKFDALLLIGIRTRGIPLAHRITSLIEKLTNQKVPVASIDFTLYRDDLYLTDEHAVQPSHIRTQVMDKNVILVDDVLFTGRSVRAAIDALIDWGRPRKVELAVLVDRGHREMPIKADFVGKNIPSSIQERVQVRLKEVDGKDEVVLIKQNALAGKGNK